MQRLETSSHLHELRSHELSGLAHSDPIRFLGAFRGRPRGFWGRGDRWVAWAGAKASLIVPHESVSLRFDQVRRQARLGLDTPDVAWTSVSPRERPRFFGGFSFLDSTEGGLDWVGFPPAAFTLPRLLMEGRDGDATLYSTGTDPETESMVKHWQRVLAGGVDGPGPASHEIPLVLDPGAEVPFGRAPTEADKHAWVSAVRRVLDAIAAGRASKAVLARYLDVRLARPVDPLVGLRFLRAENVRAHVYLFELRPGRSFLGAAPEILAELRDGAFRATAVAGSSPRGKDDSEDRDFARRLLASAKDRVEHGLTVEEMAEVLAPRLAGLEVEAEPRVLTLATIQHLETVLRGRALPGEDILSLVEALHPTPAVCGRPRGEALALIRGAEPFDRGWYSGPVGWFDAAGDGDFVPALRAAVGGGRDWRLFAGAGIVAGSDPDAEWDETTLKFEPALRALRAGADG